MSRNSTTTVPHGEVRASAVGGRAAVVAEELGWFCREAAVPGEARDTEGLSGSAEEGPVPPPG